MAAESHDAVVIGAGAGGGAAAWALSKAGMRVLVLEAGPRYDPFSDYRLHRADWERTGFPEKLTSDGRQTFAPLQRLRPRWDHLRTRNHVLGAVATGRRRAVGYSHVVGVGGSTLHYSGEAHRLHPDAFSLDSRFGVGADWPIGYDDLAPFYDLAEKLIGVAGPDSAPGRRRCAPLPAHPLSYASRRLADGFRGAGLTPEANSLAALSQPYDGRPGCNYCGNCARGCPRMDKGSADVTFIRHAEATGRCRVLADTPVLRIEGGPGDTVTRVIHAGADGARHAVTARVVVVACGAVETPRLLLNSDGLANESGLVGRHFMETLAWTASALHPDPLGSHRGLPSDLIAWDHNTPDGIAGVIGGCRFSSAVHEAGLIGPIAYARRVVGGWGTAHKAAMRAEFGRVLSVGAIGEFLPHPESFIDLDPLETDPHGLPKARLRSYLDDMALERLAFMAAKSAEVLAAAGCGPIFETVSSYDNFQATHVFGTCRMGDRPETSVTDSFGRSHRWRNLFIADASLFPTSGGGEGPSLTIAALALRSAGHIADLARSGAL